MSSIAYRNAELFIEDVSAAEIAARFGTPTYVYSAGAICERYGQLDRALQAVPHLICYAVKTNSNLAVLGLLARAGAGFDIVSAGELYRLQRVGAAAERVVFAGVGKRRDELEYALECRIAHFNLESHEEAQQLSALASRRQEVVRVALRVNPDLTAGGHAYISTGSARDKFGLAESRIPEHAERIARLPGLELVGLHCHIGSQILEVSVFGDVATRLAELTRTLRQRGFTIECLNLGGGLGIRYQDEREPTPSDFAAAITPALRDLDVRVLVEPGRYLVGGAGVLLSRVLYRKETASKTFIIVDAGMNDLVRPSLYGAYHDIVPLQAGTREREVVDVVGPLCESGDFLARQRELPVLQAGNLVAVTGAGAYGFAMSSNYNTRPRAAEVLVRGAGASCVRARESLEDLVRGESDPGAEGAAGPFRA